MGLIKNGEPERIYIERDFVELEMKKIERSRLQLALGILKRLERSMYTKASRALTRMKKSEGRKDMYEVAKSFQAHRTWSQASIMLNQEIESLENQKCKMMKS